MMPRKETADVDRQRFAVGFRYVRDGYLDFPKVYTIQPNRPGHRYGVKRDPSVYHAESVLLDRIGSMSGPRREYYWIVARTCAHPFVASGDRI